MQGFKPPPWLLLVVALLSAAGLAVTFQLTDDDRDGRPDRATLTVRPIDPGPPITAPAAQVERVAEAAEDAHGKLDHEREGKGEPLTGAQVKRNEALAERADIDGISPTLAGGATFNQRGCRTIPISRNYSTRSTRVTPTTSGHAHITVSTEVPGWGDVLGITSFFGRLGTGASSHYVIDGEGHCAYIVPETLKAWTSGNMNPTAACQIEMIGQPDANGWHRPAGMAKAALVLRDCSRRWGIPIQVGNTVGCSVVRPGLVDHNELECSNDHWDICRTSEKARTSGSDPCPIVAQIVAAMRAGQSHLTKVERTIATRRCNARARVIAAPKGSAKRRGALQTSRRARQRVRAAMTKIDRARRRDGKPWPFRHRGDRRHELAGVYTGKRCS